MHRNIEDFSNAAVDTFAGNYLNNSIDHDDYRQYIKTMRNDIGFDGNNFPKLEIVGAEPVELPDATVARVGQNPLLTPLDAVGSNFEKYDSNKDGHITFGEIEGYLNSHKASVSRVEKENLLAVGRKISILENSSNDVIGDENGITRTDLNSIFEQVEAAKFAAKYFDKADENQNGHITYFELRNYMADKQPSISEQQDLEWFAKHGEMLNDQVADDRTMRREGPSRADLSKAISDLTVTR